MFFGGCALAALGFFFDPPWGGAIFLLGLAIVLVALLALLAAAVIRRFTKKQEGICDRKGRLPRFSMRPIGIALLFVGITLSWLALEAYEARQQRLTVEAIRSGGPEVYYYYEEKGWPKWIEATVGQDFFNYVAWVNTDNPKHLPYLKRFWRLDMLELQGPAVTDADLDNVALLTRLRVLDLRRSRVTDDGLNRLTGLKRLRVLGLDRTRVTKGGVERFQKALPACVIYTDWGP